MLCKIHGSPAYHTRMIQGLMDFILPAGVLDVTVLPLITPRTVQLVDLACNNSGFHQIVGLQKFQSTWNRSGSGNCTPRARTGKRGMKHQIFSFFPVICL